MSTIGQKIVSFADLAAIRGRHESLALCSGCYDILQSGHAVFFSQCKDFAETLVVAVGRDAVIRRLKGPGRPVNPQNNRAYLVAALQDVDYVILGEEEVGEGKVDFAHILESLRPDLFVLNDDDGGIREKEALCRRLGVALKTVPRIVPAFLKPTSSTEIMEAIRNGDL